MDDSDFEYKPKIDSFNRGNEKSILSELIGNDADVVEPSCEEFCEFFVRHDD